MALPTPEALARQIGANGGPWSLYTARFSLTSEGPKRTALCVGLDISERGVQSLITSSSRSSASSLRRAGYAVDSVRTGLSATRLLRGVREVVAEIDRLTLLARGAMAPARWPHRLPRSRWGTLHPFSADVFARMSELGGWRCCAVGASRRGLPTFVDASEWRALGWCFLVVEDDDDTVLDVGVQVFPSGRQRSTPAEALPQVRRELGKRLRASGYQVNRIRSLGETPTFCWASKRVETLTEARRERARLDRLVFGPEARSPKR